MRFQLRAISTAAATALVTLLPAQSQAYQVDCAILLCLSGGWPASAECAHARAVFIRRVTPWPIEPPLQIWRCPMGASSSQTTTQRLRALAFQDAPPQMDDYHPDDFYYDTVGEHAGRAPVQVAFSLEPSSPHIEPKDAFDALAYLRLTGSTSADIDVSGHAFDFIRALRVYDVREYHHWERSRDERCIENSTIYVGSYGLQGEYTTRRAAPDDMPAWVLPSRLCDTPRRRGVGVAWASFAGDTDHEWISY